MFASYVPRNAISALHDPSYGHAGGGKSPPPPQQAVEKPEGQQGAG